LRLQRAFLTKSKSREEIHVSFVNDVRVKSMLKTVKHYSSKQGITVYFRTAKSKTMKSLKIKEKIMASLIYHQQKYSNKQCYSLKAKQRKNLKSVIRKLFKGNNS
jgi:surface antigen